MEIKLKFFFKKKLLIISFFLSFLLHFTFLTFFYFPEIQNVKTQNRKRDSLKAVEILDLSKLKISIGKISQKSESSMASNANQSRKKNRSNRAGLSLAQISLGLDMGHNLSYFDLGQEDKVGKFGDQTGVDKYQGEGENSIYGYLYQLIGSNIKYPKIFQDKEIEGYVTVRMVISKDGTYLPRLTKIWSDSPYLKVLMTRTLNGVLKDPIPFNLDFVKNDYFLVDATFRFKADADYDEDFISANTFTSGRQMRFLIQGNGVQVARLWLPKKGNLIFQGVINYETLIDTLHDKFTTAGKLKKMFYEQQLEAYKDDPAWNN